MVLTYEQLNDNKRNNANYKNENTLSNSVAQLPRRSTLPDSILLASISDFSNWYRLSSLWPLLYGTSCCFIEFASLIGSRFDFDRYGLVPRSSPRQADLIITAGTITMKMAPSPIRLYEQMPEPKYVIAMGACTITGGMFSTDSYSTVRGVDKLIPVDIHLPGCPPKPEAIIDAVTKLRKKIARNSLLQQPSCFTRIRCFSLTHQFCILSRVKKYMWETGNCSARLVPTNGAGNLHKFPKEYDKSLLAR
uniref:NAD(P)H-quinone oxidoreductase subunit K, chloroplastic n=1 Tax=Haplopteris elongata TaxID=451070 RepID=A0A3G5CTH5_9MONI|nr:NADH-plastoquinone oxidoreductase subunit K [Haplopteris elongata]AYW16165.1 NADH-plastoquinone oxidoreductase subunit K [Haplopteris elongata]